MNKILKKGLIFIIVYIGLILISTKAYATTGKTINDTTRLREKTSTDSNTLSLIPQDSEIEIIGEDGEWYKVEYKGNTGFVRKDMLEVAEDVTTNESNDTQNSPSEETNSTDTSSVQDESNQADTSSTAVQSETVKAGDNGTLTSNVELRILPSINSSKIATLYSNTQFTVKETINKWCYIETDNNSGWIFLSKIKTENKEESNNNQVQEESQENETKEEKEQENNEEKTVEASSSEVKKEEKAVKYVATETLNMREKTENDAKIVAQLTLNTQVTVEEVVDNTWTKITVKGKTGYVASKYLSDTKTDISSRSESETRKDSEEQNSESRETKSDTEISTSQVSQSTTKGSEIVEFAKKYLGCKYVSGGASPTTGFDCSGFTYYVYKNFGVTLSRTSSAQASNGTAVEKSNLQPGDLIIFNNSSNSAIGHVGIYIGGNTFIHAANKTKGVITTSLSDSYYSARYVTARRIIN